MMTSDPLRWPRRGALSVWLIWLLTYSLLLCQLSLRMLHPHFLPLATLLLAQIVAIFVAVGASSLRLVCGPRRLGAVVWLLVAAIPLLLVCSHAAYGFRIAYGSEKPLTFLTRLIAPAGAALMDAEARWRYPHRFESEHVVCFTDRSVCPDRELAALDRHIERLGEVLGHPMPGKVHWVRGSLLGLEGLSVFGLAIAPDASTTPNSEGLSYIDLHEVAHNVLNDQLPTGALPPVALLEGWADSQSDRKDLAAKAYSYLKNERSLTLRELFSSEWYFHNSGESYDLGGALVDHLTRQYGGEKFFDLCATCKPETIDEDFRRIYGTDLDELDKAYRVDVRQKAAPSAPAILTIPEDLTAKLGLPKPAPEDSAAREEFQTGYAEGLRRLKGAYRQSRMVATVTWEYAPGKDSTAPSKRVREFDAARDGDRSRLVERSRGETQIRVASPECSFYLMKEDLDQTIKASSVNAYYKAGYRDPFCSGFMDHVPLEAYYRTMWQDVPELLSSQGIRIISVNRVAKDGRSMVRVHFERGYTANGRRVLEAGWLTFDPGELWALQDYEIRSTTDDSKAPAVSQGEVRYNASVNGVPSLRSSHFRFGSIHNPGLALTGEVARLEFGPVSDEEFDLATYGLARPEEPTAMLRTIQQGSLAAAAACALLASVLAGHRSAGRVLIIGKTPAKDH